MRTFNVGPDRKLRFLWAGAIVLATLLVYARVAHGEFQFDDEHAIERSLRIKDLRNFASPGAWDPASRPLTELTFAVNYEIGKLDPFGYHLANVAIHLAVALLLFLLGRRTLALAGIRNAGWIAAAVAGAFALHPLQTETASYVVQRSESLASLFVVGGVLLLRRAEERPGWRAGTWLLAATACGAAGLASKPVAATLPLLYLLYSQTFPAPPPAQPTPIWRRLALASPLLALSILSAARALLPAAHPVAAGTAPAASAAADAGFGVAGLSLRDYLLTQAGVLFRYLRLVAWPSGLDVDPDVPIVRSLDAGTALAVIGVAALVAGAVLLATGSGPRFARGPTSRVSGFGMLWFVIALLPTTLVPLVDPMAEHRLYLALWGPLLAAGVGLHALLARLRAPPAVLAGVAMALLGALAACTWVRNAVWETRVALWTDAVAKSPDKLRPKLNLAHAHALRGEIQRAVDEYRSALAGVEPTEIRTGPIYRNVGVLLFQLGKPDEAAEFFTAAASDPGVEADARNNLAIIFLERGMPAEARSQAERSLLRDPRHGAARNTLGEILLAGGDAPSALAQFEEAARLDPDLPSRTFNVALALERLGRTREACAAWSRYLSSSGPSAADSGEVRSHRVELGCEQGR